MSAARRTALYEAHKRRGGKLVEFAGWELPVQYSGLLDEHRAVRTAAGLFDVSHMGEFVAEGEGALALVDRLVTNDLTKLVDGQAAYAGLLNERGGFVDDVVCYRFSPTKILVCVNAANVEKDWAHVVKLAGPDAKLLRNDSDRYSQLALQGPKAAAVLQRLTSFELSGLKTYHFAEAKVDGRACIVARTGYTGEDGFELFCSNEDAVPLFDRLLDTGAADGVKPAGLGARDSLRTEMKYALYGNDIDDEHTPLEAGLGWIVKLDKPDFVGKAALVAQKAAGVPRKLVGFECTGRGIPRHGYPICKDGVRVGEVTSGTQSPSLDRPIGIGYVPAALAAEGSTFDIEIRGKPVPARVVKTPFYKRS